MVPSQEAPSKNNFAPHRLARVGWKRMQTCHKAKILPPTLPAGCTAPRTPPKELPRDPEQTWTVQTQEVAPSVLGQMLPTQWILSETTELVLIWFKINKELSRGPSQPEPLGVSKKQDQNSIYSFEPFHPDPQFVSAPKAQP